MDSHQSDMVARFSAVTGANPSTAQAALENTDWNLEEAVTLFYAANDEAPPHDADAEFDDELSLNEPSVPNTTPSNPSSSSARPAASSRAATSTPAKRPPGQHPKQMTLADLKKMRSEPEDAEEDDDDDDKPQDLYAGGEKSGLAVQNPDSAPGPSDHFRNILSRARQNVERPAAADAAAQPSRRSNFSGRAQTLGGDDVESRAIDDPAAGGHQAEAPTRVSRTLHLWADGVSIDDGPLFRFDDPANQGMMAQINQGRAPLSLLDVQPDQEVDLSLVPHRDENYTPPPKKYKPFAGQGQRLGSPIPGLSSSAATAAVSSASTSAPTTSAPSSSTSSAPQVSVDEAQPTIQLQIRLGDGTRLASRFNTSHTIGDVYDFVNRAQSGAGARSWVLMTTFPSKELADKSAVLGEMGEFKRGGSVVQKWT